MPTVEIRNLEELKSRVGTEVAVTDWFTMTQERVNLFAEATEDRQWIHIDPERSRRESPFKAPVAHGFLTLSLLSHFLGEAVHMPTARMGVNYGLNKVRFTAPVPVGARIRARFTLQALEQLPGNGVQMTWGVTVEEEGKDKPSLVAEWLTRRYE